VLEALEAVVQGDFHLDQCEIVTYPQWPCLTIEVQSYEQERLLTRAGDFIHAGAEVHVSAVDIARFVDNASIIWAALPGLVSGTTLDFSASSDASMLHFGSVPVVETALFMAFLYCRERQIQIETIDFSNSGLTSLAAIKFSMGCFPHLRAVNVIGCSIRDIDQAPRDLPNISVVLVQPEIPEFDLPIATFEPVMDSPPIGFEIPWLFCPSLVRPPPKLQLSDYPPIHMDPIPVTQFITQVFEMMWHGFEHCLGFYADFCYFSLTIDPEEFDLVVQEFAPLATNIMIDSDHRVCGRESICGAWEHIFPNGFRAHITQIEGTELVPHLLAVVVHGVVEGPFDAIVGFDRSLTLKESFNVFTIVNDHLTIRRAPPP
jgi:hypothetical protein